MYTNFLEKRFFKKKINSELYKKIFKNLKFLLEKKKFIIVMIFIFTIIPLGYYFYRVFFTSNIEGVISYYYEGVERGFDPSGKYLNTSELKNEKLLKKIVDKMNLNEYGIDETSLKSSIGIYPLSSGSVVSSIKSSEEEKEINIKESEQYTYFPTKYKIILSDLNGYKINSIKSREILNEVILEYKKYFYKKYSDIGLLDNIIGEFDYDRYDYPEISTVINNQIYTIQNFLSTKESENEGANFRAETTNQSFDDITKSLELVKTINVEKMDSIIGAYNLTKDKEKLIKLYEHRIKILELEKNKKWDESEIKKNMMDKFQKEKNIIYMPGLDLETGSDESVNKIESEKDDGYFEELADESTKAGITAKTDAHDADFYRNRIEKLQIDDISKEEKDIAIGNVNKILFKIKKDLNKWIQISNDTLDEYYEKVFFSNSLKSSGLNYSLFSYKKIGLNILFGCLSGLMFSIVILLMGKLGSSINLKVFKKKRKVRKVLT